MAHPATRKQTAKESRGTRSGGNRPPLGPPAAPAAIPDKLYFRIGEVARLCQVPAYVLRFWESEFPQLRPNKGGTGQRLFRRRDVEAALRIKGLLYDEGYTIPGARQLLKSEVKTKEPQLSLLAQVGESDPARREQLRRLRGEMRHLLAMLEQPASSRTSGPAAVPAKPARRAFSSSRRSGLATVPPPVSPPIPLPIPKTERLFELPPPARADSAEPDTKPERPQPTHE